MAIAADEPYDAFDPLPELPSSPEREPVLEGNLTSAAAKPADSAPAATSDPASVAASSAIRARPSSTGEAARYGQKNDTNAEKSSSDSNSDKDNSESSSDSISSSSSSDSNSSGSGSGSSRHSDSDNDGKYIDITAQPSDDAVNNMMEDPTEQFQED
mmetsp:Transcript_8468/g.19115  ORF Transcript_8468/g.19115 Transcript_8468/m.19115 type:complete len:157 (+) Transcript_8468:151-621(+)